MSTKNFSRVSLSTLQEVIDALALREDLSAQRRLDLRSSLRTFSKALGKTPDQVPADIGALNSQIAGLTAQMVGLSAPRWANVKSGLTAALTVMSYSPSLGQISGLFKLLPAPADRFQCC